MREKVLRPIELGVAILSTYMAAVTLIQTTLYSMIVEMITARLTPILGPLNLYLEHFDIIVLGLVLALCLRSWSKGDEIAFGRIFNLNMLMFFPAVLDFSTFNWIVLILDYDPQPRVSAHWVFGVGLILQGTYLFLRHTVRLRYARDELSGRGAENQDLEEITTGQFNYLAVLVGGTVVLSILIYLAVPFLGRIIGGRVVGVPSPQIIIGVFTTIMLAGALILYLRDAILQSRVETSKSEIPEGEGEPMDSVDSRDHWRKTAFEDIFEPPRRRQPFEADPDNIALKRPASAITSCYHAKIPTRTPSAYIHQPAMAIPHRFRDPIILKDQAGDSRNVYPSSQRHL